MLLRPSYPSPPLLSPLSRLLLFVVFSTFLLSVCAQFPGPICEPGFLGSNDMYEISDDGDEGVAITLNCTGLTEPGFGVTVLPPLQPLINSNNFSVHAFYWHYSCEAENISISTNFSADLPTGIGNRWSRSPIFASSSSMLPLGTSCSFFGCYRLTARDIFSSNVTHYIFNFNSTSCIIDADECSDGSARCERGCTDIRNGSSNSYECTCPTGYVMSSDLHNCTDVDECYTEENNCDDICTTNSSSGWFNCSCEDGFSLDEDGHTCNDINECEGEGEEGRNGTVLCETETTGRECNNTYGDYDCICPQGFYFDNTTNNCTDIDECEVNGSDPCQYICTNTHGGYNCTCPTWYQLIGQDNCTAIDVCTEEAVSCGSHSSCVNSPDSVAGHVCVCDSGYSQNGPNSCNITGLSHIIWIGTVILLALLLILLLIVFFLIRRYINRRRDVMRKYSILFRYQMRREELDPSHNPVPCTPVRKVSYTFSLVSSLETYDYPLTPTPTFLELDENIINTGSGSGTMEQTTKTAGSLPNGQFNFLTTPESSKRELSPIIEGNEESTPVGKAMNKDGLKMIEAGEDERGEEEEEEEERKTSIDTSSTVGSESRVGYLEMDEVQTESNNTSAVAQSLEKQNFGFSERDYVIEEFSGTTTSDIGSKLLTTGGDSSSSVAKSPNPRTPNLGTKSGNHDCNTGKDGYVVEDSNNSGTVELVTSQAAVIPNNKLTHSFAAQESNDIETGRTEVQNSSPLDNVRPQSRTNSKLRESNPNHMSSSSSPYVPLTAAMKRHGASLSATNDGYIPSNFSTTSSGYGSEEGNNSSFSYKSRYFSTSSSVADSGMGSVGSYIPDTSSCRYLSEEGAGVSVPNSKIFVPTSGYVTEYDAKEHATGSPLSTGFTMESGMRRPTRTGLSSGYVSESGFSSREVGSPLSSDYLSETPSFSSSSGHHPHNQQVLPQTKPTHHPHPHPPHPSSSSGSYLEDSVFSEDHSTHCSEYVESQHLPLYPPPPITTEGDDHNSGRDRERAALARGYISHSFHDLHRMTTVSNSQCEYKFELTRIPKAGKNYSNLHRVHSQSTDNLPVSKFAANSSKLRPPLMTGGADNPIISETSMISWPQGGGYI